MATNTNQGAKPLRLSSGPVQMSAVAPQRAARLRFNGVYIFDDTLCEVGTFVADNAGYITFPIGQYTYRQWQLVLEAPAAIAGVTDDRFGKNVVRTSKVEDYIDMLSIEINGKSKWELRAAELVKLNAYQNHDTTEGVLRIVFGSPNIHDADLVEDAYQFGTSGLRQVRLRVKTKAAWVNGMKLAVGCEYAPVARPIGYFVTTSRYAVTNPAAGAFSITDLANGIDFSSIWVQGAGIKDANLVIDRVAVFSASNWQLRSLNQVFGKDMAGLGEGIMLDAFRDGDSVGYDSVTNNEPERKRGADIRLDLTMTAANTDLTIVVFHCGLFSEQ